MMKPKFDGYAAQYDAWFMENDNLFQSELRLSLIHIFEGQLVAEVGVRDGDQLAGTLAEAAAAQVRHAVLLSLIHISVHRVQQVYLFLLFEKGQLISRI